MPDVQRLKEDEAHDYEWTIHIMDVYMGPRKTRLTELEAERLSIARRVSRYFERLSACRALLEEAQQYIKDEISGMPFDDKQVKELENRGKKIYTAIAAQLKDLKGE